jgi:hypothetical protein
VAWPPQPTIAAVNGWCVGGGFCVLHACDLVLAADHAVFSLSEINFGSIPGGGAMRAALREEAGALARGLARHSWQILEWCKRTAHGLRGIADRTLAIEYETAMSHFVASTRPPVEVDERLGAFRDKRYKPGVEAYPDPDESR